jgi:hypothetical protein
MAGTTGTFGTLGSWLGGAKNWFESLDSDNMAVLLGRAGAAVSPKDSWQQRLGATAAKMGAQEQSRKYLSELLGTTAEEEEEEGAIGTKGNKSKLTTGQLDALRNPGLGSVLSDYFSRSLPRTGR